MKILILLALHTAACIVGLAASIYSAIAVSPAYLLCVVICAYGLGLGLLEAYETRQERAR